MRETFIHEYLNQESLPADPSCKQCKTRVGSFRCLDCFGPTLLCHPCCLEVHSSLPFHSIEKWTGEFFQKTSLHAEGFKLYLGHGGSPCPANSTAAAEYWADEDLDGDKVDEILLEAWEPRDTRTMVIVDVSRIHQLIVSWCCCEGAPDHGTQLFQHCLFPASFSRPSTAFTFAVLDYFHVDAVECKTAASNFFSKLRRLTDFTSPQSVPVSELYHSSCLSNEFKDRYRELMRVSRLWRDLKARVSSGLGHEINPTLQPGELAIFCPACPQPGVNLPKNWEKDPKRYVINIPNIEFFIYFF